MRRFTDDSRLGWRFDWAFGFDRVIKALYFGCDYARSFLSLMLDSVPPEWG